MTYDIDKHWSNQYIQRGDFRSLFATELAEILSHTNDTLLKNCLDVGCGTGGLTRELYHKGYECIGMDVSNEAIQVARQATIFGDKLKYIHGNFETDNLDMVNAIPFSLITCKLVYAFMRDKAAFLKKVYEMLSDDGTFIIITPIHAQQNDASPISVDKSTTLDELRGQFKIVSQLELGWATCFICKK